jgi:NTP pyrophosphatase (non-canonical NTP hydrolase)
MSTVADPLTSGSPGNEPRPRVVLSGSYRRDLAGLGQAYDQLCAAGCDVLSPASLDFVDEIDGFVMTKEDGDDSPAEIEARHITAMRQSDLVWLHAPEGYVGPSAALEIGVAHSLDIPIYGTTSPADTTLAQFVIGRSTPQLAAEVARRRGARTPARPLRDLQHYYDRVSDERGFHDESAQDTMLLLMEEIGELARSVRQSAGLARATPQLGDVAGELADVQLYVLHLSNIVGVDLAGAVAEKEQHNHRRYGRVAA